MWIIITSYNLQLTLENIIVADLQITTEVRTGPLPAQKPLEGGIIQRTVG